jgi:hypothetical protein
MSLKVAATKKYCCLSRSSSLLLAVVGIEHLGEVLGAAFSSMARTYWAVLEEIQVELAAGPGRPQPQVDDVVVALARDEHVHGHGHDVLGGGPLVPHAAQAVGVLLDLAVGKRTS